MQLGINYTFPYSKFRYKSRGVPRGGPMPYHLRLTLALGFIAIAQLKNNGTDLAGYQLVWDTFYMPQSGETLMEHIPLWLIIH